MKGERGQGCNYHKRNISVQSFVDGIDYIERPKFNPISHGMRHQSCFRRPDTKSVTKSLFSEACFFNAFRLEA